ncbi:MAG: hypothetical protein WCF36_20785 [Candidatus Nanopelagicales bacterium]
MWNIDIPSRDALLALAALRQPGVVTIYLPTTPLTKDAQADRITLKNLASQAVARLAELPELSREQIKEVSEELDDLVDDDDFWAHQAAGLAVIATPDRLTTFRLATEVPEQLQVSDRVHLKALLTAIAEPRACYVLALAEGGARLIEVPADLRPQELRVQDMPDSAAGEAGRTSINDRSHSGRLVGSEGKRTHLRHYARAVDSALRPVLAGEDSALILAATEPIRSIFRSVNSYPYLADAQIETSPERMSEAELADAARPLLGELFADRMAQLARTFDERTGQGRAHSDIADAAWAATAGAVDTLIVDRDYVQAGTVAQDGSVEFSDAPGADPNSYGVTDEIARRVLETGGRVLSVEASVVPGGQALAAILRYTI